MIQFRPLLNAIMVVLISLTTLIGYSQNLGSIRVELEQLELGSIELRNHVMPTIRDYGFKSPQMDSLNHAIMKFDSIALHKVQFIIDQYGWLGKSEVGVEANRALFLTIQHAQDHLVREKYFPLLKASAEAGESDLTAMATMQDRILVEQGEKQLYGTQSRMVNGQQELYPVEDPDELNKRRKKVGLGKMEY